ncbi:hypothetical protein PO909_003598, partial [Leuciscus waleckii]
MEFIKEEIEDMSDHEPSRVKHEDTEEQIDQMETMEQRHKLNEVDETFCNEKTQRKKAKNLHICSQCGKSYTYISGLKKHLCFPSGEKPFNCDQCGKGFSSSSNLNQHLIIHAGEKPYVCSLCGKSFSRLDHCKQHQK